MNLLIAALFTWNASATVKMTDWDGSKLLVFTKGELLEVCGDGATAQEASLDLNKAFVKNSRVSIPRDGVFLTIYPPYRPTLKKVTELSSGRVSVCLTIVAET